MRRFCILLIFLTTIFESFAFSQVKIRIFSLQSPEMAIFTVLKGEYQINSYDGNLILIKESEPVIISRYNGKLAIKSRNEKGFVCDSVEFIRRSDEGLFSMAINNNGPLKQYYSGDLKCLPDFGTILLINNCDIEKYISGVVRSEGGTGKNSEFFKTQAVIARTYMYKYFDKHIADRYNVCDNTHCQAYNGLSFDSIIDEAVLATARQVILNKDSTLIISAFHSNCGGETASSEDVWLTSQPYLSGVRDPFCTSSRNARWGKKISIEDWLKYLRKAGFNGSGEDISSSVFQQESRLTDYKIGSFSLPLGNIRTEMNLRSTFFSLTTEGDSVLLKGKGYGHGVGLCQEGAMAMALKGFNYRQIINFYYSGVIIADIKNAVNIPWNSHSNEELKQ